MKQLKLFVGALAISVLWLVVSPRATHAMNLIPDPGTTGMPSNLRSDLMSCDTSGHSPGFEQWVSLVNAPTTLSVNLDYGTPSLSLDYHFSGAICYPNSAVTDTRARIGNPSAYLNNFSLPDSSFGFVPGGGAQTRDLTLSWGGAYNQVGAYRHQKQTFTFAPQGGFTKSGTYKIQLDQKTINAFTTGIFGCVPQGTAGSLNDFNSCPNATPTFSINVTITNPPKFDHRAQVKSGTNSPSGGEVALGQVYDLYPLIRNQGPQTAAGDYAINILGVQNLNTARADPYFPGDGTGIGSLTPTNNQADIFGKKKDYVTGNKTCDPQGVDPGECWVWGVTNLGPGAEANASFKFQVTSDPSAVGKQICFLPFAKRRGVDVDVFTGTQQCFTIKPGISLVCSPDSDYPGQLIKDQPDRNGDGVVNGDDCFNLPDKPYLSVYGSDVLAGGNFGQLCTALNQSASIESWAETLPSTTTWRGASSQFGAFALGSIDGFFTANLRGLNAVPRAPFPPVDLTFGNTNNGTSKVAQNSGGQSGQTTCITDYYNNRNGAPVVNGNIPIGATGISGPQAAYFNGDVFITGDITFNNVNNWGSSVSNIPSLLLVVKGNIYISPSVKRLDGIYVARPDDTGKRGEIITCATQFGELKPPHGACPDKLTINGTFIARQVRFLREFGKLAEAVPNENTSNSHAGEVFNFSPEVYLSPMHSSQTRTVPFTKYDYITSLPPVL